MPLIAAKILIGLLVGTLVGMTGLGGGVLMLPLLIFGLGVPPIIAVGSDAVINCFTKMGAGYLHWRQGTVNWKVTVALAQGSIPGALAGIGVLALIRGTYGNAVNDFLRTAIGVLLVVIPVLLALRMQLSRNLDRANRLNGRSLPKSYAGITAIGLVAGFLVGVTSVGSGSIVLVMLLLFYGFAPAVMVGTDIVHAVILTGTAGLLHLRLGTVDPWLVACVLIGSIPGGVLGTYLTARVPVYWFKRLLCVLLFLTGARMLWA